MKTLYLDLFSGISGDMFLGALLDLGVSLADLERGLQQLEVSGYHLHARRDKRGDLSGIRFEVHLTSRQHEHTPDEDHGPEPGERRDFACIRRLLESSSLSAWVKEKSVAVFRRVAEAEGRIHGCAPEEVHFHEVGATDSIVDIVGAALALELLGKPRVLASHVTEGVGLIECAHGRFPLPAPATVEILAQRRIALSQCDEPHELVTPTGAALLAEFVECFGPLNGLTVERVGYGVGLRHNRTRPNVLRVVLGELARPAAIDKHDWECDQVAVLEANLDDQSPELLGHFVESALAAGALDVFFTPAQMKKSRPGVLLTVLCQAEAADHLSVLMLRETSTFGVRRTLAERRKLQRAFHTVQTEFGDVTVKIGRFDGQVVHTAPEYESCRQLAERRQVAVRQVYEAALRAAQALRT
jgi:uncharacterized protein (TIGR00299 family) protein